MIGISFLLVILPYVPRAYQHWLIAAYLSSIYVDSAIHKLASPMWSHGYGLAAPMTFPSLAWVNTGWMSMLPGWTWHAGGYAVVGFELLFPALYLFRQTRLVALLIGFAMHLGIGVIYPIPVFAGVMLSLYAALLVEWFRRRGRRNEVPRADGMPRITPRLVFVFAVWLTAIADVYYPIKPARKAIYMATGISSHAVFEDDGFRGYGYQLRLIMDGRGQSAFPYSRGNLLAWDIRDRVWELWWKRSGAPPVLVRDAERHLVAWIAAAGVNGARVQARVQKVVLDRVDSGLFAENDAAVWRDVGRIENGQVHWGRAAYWQVESDPHQKLGSLIRVLLQ